MTAVALASLGRGFDDPAQDAQRSFRCLLEAMSRPGRIQTIAPSALGGMQAPGVGVGLCAVLLTMLDAETSVCVDPALSQDTLMPYLRFHTGVRPGTARNDSDFVAIGAADADAGLWGELRMGTDEAPQRGATLIVDVPAFDRQGSSGVRLRLRGPGVESMQELFVAGLDARFWRARVAAQAHFPLGIDLVLCCGERIAAIPRSTRIEIAA